MIKRFALLLGLLLAPLAAHADTQCTPRHLLSAATNNATSITIATPTWLCGYLSITNTTSTTGMDLRLYDVNGAPNCASATGVVLNIPVPAAATAADVASIVVPLGVGMTFQHGIGLCLTGAVSDSDNSPAVTGVQVNYGTIP
jgi:hypothetical protein